MFRNKFLSSIATSTKLLHNPGQNNAQLRLYKTYANRAIHINKKLQLKLRNSTFGLIGHSSHDDFHEINLGKGQGEGAFINKTRVTIIANGNRCTLERGVFDVKFTSDGDFIAKKSIYSYTLNPSFRIFGVGACAIALGYLGKNLLEEKQTDNKPKYGKK